MKVALQITKKHKRGCYPLEVRYFGKSPNSVIVVRGIGALTQWALEITDDLELICLKFGVNYDTWTKVWVRLQVKEQSNDFGQKPEAKEEAS